MNTVWIGPYGGFEVGEVGFLVADVNALTGVTRYELRDSPIRTSPWRESHLYWCGRTDNHASTNACGLGEVLMLTSDGRARVRRLEDGELSAALIELGYPEMAARFWPGWRRNC